jgi:hypothetical protein
MKRILLLVLVVCALVTSCKSEKKEAKDTLKEVTTEVEKEVKVVETKDKEITEEVSKMVASALEGITIPEFENEEVTKHLQMYSSYAKDYIAAKGDVLKNAKLAKQGIALAVKGKELLSSLDAESAKKFKSVMNSIQSKIAPAN